MELPIFFSFPLLSYKKKENPLFSRYRRRKLYAATLGSLRFPYMENSIRVCIVEFILGKHAISNYTRTSHYFVFTHLYYGESSDHRTIIIAVASKIIFLLQITPIKKALCSVSWALVDGISVLVK